MHSTASRLSAWLGLGLNYWTAFVVLVTLISYRVDRSSDISPKVLEFSIKSDVETKQINYLHREIAIFKTGSLKYKLDFSRLKDWNTKIIQWHIIAGCYSPNEQSVESDNRPHEVTIFNEILNTKKNVSLLRENSLASYRPIPFNDGNCQMKTKLYYSKTPYIGLFYSNYIDL
ncbi:MAG: hypothetical protein MHPSP_001832, partial [Paramarteilia canceri]